MNYEQEFALTAPDQFRLNTFSASELQDMEFPPIKWIVQDILPEGLTLICGKPKFGKSWFVLDMAFAVAEGDQFLGATCVQGSVLYLALEDNQRRLQDRLQKIKPSEEWPSELSMINEAPRIGAGGLRSIENWIATQQNPRLIIVDTLATIRPPKSGGQTDYLSDYAALRGLHRIASEHRVSVVVVHHVRKTEGDDPFDTVSGSTGITGAADATLILTKRTEDGGVVLYGRGRDLQEFEKGVEFDQERCRWKYVGDPDTVFLGGSRQRILKALEAGMQTPTAICEHSQLTMDNTNQLLKRMAEKGQIVKSGRGLYETKARHEERLSTLSEVSVCQLGAGETDKLTELTPLVEVITADDFA
jgi:hypothetical protein